MKRKSFSFSYLFHRSYNTIVDKRINEKIVLDLMNKSAIIFPETYKLIKTQSNNESDFVSTSGKYYDVKLLFSKKQCFNLAARNGNDIEFFKSIISYEKVGNLIDNNDTEKVRKTDFYCEMKKRIKSSNVGEGIILFFPFTLTLEFMNSYTTIFNYDIFSKLWWLMIEEDPSILKNEVFMIYPCYDGTILLRNMNTNQREFVDDKVLYNYYHAVDTRLKYRIINKIKSIFCNNK